MVGEPCQIEVGRAQRRIKANWRGFFRRLPLSQSSEAALENLARFARGASDMRRGDDRILDKPRWRGRPGKFQRVALVEPKVGAFCDRRHHRLPHAQGWLGKPQREIHATDDRWTQSMNVVGDPNRRDGGSLNRAIHEHLTASSLEDVIPIKASDKIVGLIDDDDSLSRYAADRVSDEGRRDPFPSIGFEIFLVRLPAKLNREVDAGAERLGEFRLACSRGGRRRGR